MKLGQPAGTGRPQKFFDFFSRRRLRNPIKRQKTTHSVTNDLGGPFKKIFKKVKKNLVRPKNLA
jgi:hypothetical protein